MTDLVRLFYTSKASGHPADTTAEILTQSVSKNSVSGITGVLFRLDDRYVQVLEGPRQTVQELMERLHRDPRHHSIEIHFFRPIREPLFEGWAMASPEMDDTQVRSTVDLLTSHDQSSQDIGLTYLKYWLTTRTDRNSLPELASSKNPILVDEYIQSHDRSRNFSIMAFLVAILLAVMLDVSFFIVEFLEGQPGSLAMIHAHALTAIGIACSAFVAKRINLSRGIGIFQFTAVVAVGMHVLYAGYGIKAPSLCYLGLGIMSGIIANKPDRNHTLLLVSVALILTAIAINTYAPWGLSLSQPVPDHHTALAALLFPLVCAVVLDAQRFRNASVQSFSAHVLGDLGMTIDRLRKAMKARNYFFSAISHEIRTPMAGAIASVALLKHPNASEDIKSRSLHSLDQSLHNLNRLLNDLLDISKLESGRFQLASEPFDLNTVTQETLEFFLPSVVARGNRLNVKLPDGATTVLGDSMRYQQMLSNLVSNAVKFTEGGNINVTVSVTGSDGDGQAPLWKCVVRDNGVGIPAADLPFLFQPFSQASQHGYSKVKGTGLGLAIVASLAKQMQGDAGVDSREGEGSTFWFTFRLPYAPPETGQNTATTGEAASRPPARQNSGL